MEGCTYKKEIPLGIKYCVEGGTIRKEVLLGWRYS